MKQNLRALIESIVIEALEGWMDECDEMEEADSKGGVKAFGGGDTEKKSSKKNEGSKKSLPPAFLKNVKKKSSKK
jgi:hypothetical protein